MPRIRLCRGWQIWIVLAALTALLTACSSEETVSLYADEENWAFWAAGEDKPVDIFVIAPTVEKGEAGNRNADIEDENYRSRLTAGLNTQLGLYEDACTVYAPYYRQAALSDYLELSEEERSPYIEIAYDDVREAFSYYFSNCDADRPLILFGFSQGGQLAIRLMKDFFADEDLQDRLVAAYTIGYYITEEEVAAYPQLRMAQAEDDTGVIICYEVESEDTEGSPIVPEGVRSLSINPLNWKTDDTPADRSLNTGACFVDKEKNITEEIPNLTGAYIRPERGTLIAVDIVPEEYSNKFFPDGVYHLNDLYFFYRNLQENICRRIEAYQN